MRTRTSRANNRGWNAFHSGFQGPAEVFLPQHIYSLAHEQMGDFDLFLVPIARDERGFRYESVFNYRIKE